MKRGIKLAFTGKPYATIDLGASVSGLEASGQNALVVVTNGLGTDRVFPDKGTTLPLKVMTGAVFDPSSAVHACNFAAVDALFFCAEHELTENSAWGLTAFTLTPQFRTNNIIALAAFTARNGDVKNAPAFL